MLRADSVVHARRLRAHETNEKELANFSESMNPCFFGLVALDTNCMFRAIDQEEDE